MAKIIKLDQLSNTDIQSITKSLKKGKISIIPTETVYGLIGDSTKTEALERIYALKQRPINKPIAILLHSANQAMQLIHNALKNTKAILGEEENTIYQLLTQGATIVIETNQSTMKSIQHVQNYIPWKTIGIRIPQNESALQIVKHCNTPLYATSVNLTSQPPVTQFSQISQHFLNNTEYAIDNDMEVSGTPSTVISFVAGKELKVLRQGSVKISP